jgi:hypothetical protein
MRRMSKSAFDQFLLQKLLAAFFTLAAIAQNLRRLAKLVARPPAVVDPCLA